MPNSWRTGAPRILKIQRCPLSTVFPHIVAAATILFWIHLVRKLFKEMKLFKGGNYMRKYGILIFGQKSCFLGPTIFKIPQPNWY
jgi:hypothetical protein